MANHVKMKVFLSKMVSSNNRYFWNSMLLKDINPINMDKFRINPVRSTQTITKRHCFLANVHTHLRYYYNGVIMSAIAAQITSLTSVYSRVYSGVDQRKHQSSASLAFVRGIHGWPVNSPHKGPVARKIFPFDDVIMDKETPQVYFITMEYIQQDNIKNALKLSNVTTTTYKITCLFVLLLYWLFLQVYRFPCKLWRHMPAWVIICI